MTPGEERLLRHERRRQMAGQAAEAARFADYGLSMADALERLRNEPRRRCPCAAHARARV
jgi:hypothetical protein